MTYDHNSWLNCDSTLWTTCMLDIVVQSTTDPSGNQIPYNRLFHFIKNELKDNFIKSLTEV